MGTRLQHDVPAPLETDAQPAIRYESYLLRLRRVAGPAGERRQVWLIAVQDHEERYFSSLRELTAYLRQCRGEREPGPPPSTQSESQR